MIALCELETDKAVYPIESSFAGTMGEWKTEVDATVEIGQELGIILTESAGDDFADQMEAAAEVSPHAESAAVTPVAEIKRAHFARARAFGNDHAQTRPRRAGEPSDRRPLGCDSRCARSGEEERRQECAFTFGHGRVGGGSARWKNMQLSAA